MKRIPLISFIVLVMMTTTHAQPSPDFTHLNVDGDKVALEGYDPVAYFKQKKAIVGKPGFSVVEGGIKYQFSTQANKTLFLESPVLFKPQYGGWCAYAMGAKAEKVEVDPETFKIVNGKLYLFYNKFFNNTMDTWNKNEAQLKTNADKNWNNLIKP